MYFESVEESPFHEKLLELFVGGEGIVDSSEEEILLRALILRVDANLFNLHYAKNDINMSALTTVATSNSLRFTTLSRIDLDAILLLIHSDHTSLDSIQNADSRTEEGLLDVLVTLGRRLDIEHILLGGQFETLITRYPPFVGHVYLITDQDENNTLSAVVPDILYPPPHIFERFRPCTIINH